MTITEHPYLKLDAGIVTVCAWCYPGASILNVAPELKGMRISHDVCPDHKAQMLSQARSFPKSPEA